MGIEVLRAQGSSQRFIAHRYGTTESIFHNWMQKHGIKKQVLKDMNPSKYRNHREALLA